MRWNRLTGLAGRVLKCKVRTKIPMNLVVIMNEVGREVWRFPQPAIFRCSLVSKSRAIPGNSRDTLLNSRIVALTGP